MSKNILIRKHIKKIIDNEKIEASKRKIYKTTQVISPTSQTKIVYEVRNLIQEESKKSLEKLSQNPWTRDISHIQDKISQPSISLPILPMDIQDLKKLNSIDWPSFQSFHKCRSDQCLELYSNKKAETERPHTIDRYLLGNPTGRQDIIELCTWFNNMLDIHKDSDVDVIMLIHEICVKEIIRQVSVHCIERGELLKVLFDYQPEIYSRKFEEASQKMEKIKENDKKKLETIRLEQNQKIAKLEEKLRHVLKLCENHKNEKEKLSSDLHDFRKKYYDFIKKHENEEKIWKSKNYVLLQRLKTSFKEMTKHAYQLSVISWKINSPDNEEALDINHKKQPSFLLTPEMIKLSESANDKIIEELEEI